MRVRAEAIGERVGGMTYDREGRREERSRDREERRRDRRGGAPQIHPREESYSGEELSEVIARAARMASREPSSKLSYDEMVAVGRDLGIDEANLLAAAQEVVEGRKTRRRQIRRKFGFYHHLAVYASVITGLFAINMATGDGHLWFLFPAFGWGIGLACHGMSVYLAEKRAELERLA